VREAEQETIAASGEVYELREQIRLSVDLLRRRRPLISAEESRKRVICCLEAEWSIREGREVALSFGEPCTGLQSDSSYDRVKRRRLLFFGVPFSTGCQVWPLQRS
jgi:hypothetical protein